MNSFANKKILVTGGTGSLGAEIVRELLCHKPKVVRILSRDESKQFQLQKELRAHDNVRFLLGDIRDEKRLRYAMEEIDVVFHTAALKHVSACEYNPFEALKTNVIGSMNVIEAAIAEKVKKVVFTSTDKATNPCNTMGVSKLLAERLMTAAQSYAGSHDIVVCSVRFGNVLGSRGSFLPLLKQQIANGGPVTVTNPDMTRFVMSLEDSLNLVFKSLAVAKGGEVFILKMPVLRLADLVEVVIAEEAPRHGLSPRDIAIEYIGSQPGEKIYEELATAEEMERVLELDDMYVLLPQLEDDAKYKKAYAKAKKPRKNIYSSREEKVLSKKAIKTLLQTAGLL